MAKVVKKVAKKVAPKETPKKVVKATPKKGEPKVKVKKLVVDGWRTIDKRWEKRDTKCHQLIKDGKNIIDGVVLENGDVKVYSANKIEAFKGMKEFKSKNENEPRPFYYTVNADVFAKFQKGGK